MEEFNDLLVEWETDAHQGIGNVDHGQGNLEQEMEKLMVKLKAVQVKMEEGEGLYVRNELKSWPVVSKWRRCLLQPKRPSLCGRTCNTKQEVLKVEEFVNGLGIIVPVVADEKKLEKDEVCRLI